MLRAAAVERSAPAGGYASVDEVRGRAAFEALRAEWDALVARGPVDVPFASHAWLSAWLEAFAPAAEPLVLVARGRGGAALGLAAFLVQSWRGLLRRDVPRDGPTSALLEPLARADRHLTGRWESLRTPFIRLGGRSAEERTSARFRANLRRRTRRLLELGAVAVRRAEAPDEVDGAVRDFLALEASGWKGAGGTAIAL